MRGEKGKKSIKKKLQKEIKKREGKNAAVGTVGKSPSWEKRNANDSIGNGAFILQSPLQTRHEKRATNKSSREPTALWSKIAYNGEIKQHELIALLFIIAGSGYIE